MPENTCLLPMTFSVIWVGAFCAMAQCPSGLHLRKLGGIPLIGESLRCISVALHLMYDAIDTKSAACSLQLKYTLQLGVTEILLADRVNVSRKSRFGWREGRVCESQCMHRGLKSRRIKLEESGNELSELQVHGSTHHGGEKREAKSSG
ncbi:hypothetical protein MRX96_055463 [Rhipicephalus microplus]